MEAPSSTIRGPVIKNIPGGPTVFRTIPVGVSDGDKSKWPTGPNYRKGNSNNYLVRLAYGWANRDGTAKPNTNYCLTELPEGYAVFDTDQPGGPQVYKRLFGHPTGKFYDSILKFETHLYWLLDGKPGACQCVNCGTKSLGAPRRKQKDPIPAKPKSSLRATRLLLSAEPPSNNDNLSKPGSNGDLTSRPRRARNTEQRHPTDEEGTHHVYREALGKLYIARDSENPREIDILEKGSIDWTAEEEPLREYLTQIESQHSFVPRRGELVLWCIDIPEDQFLLRDQQGLYKLYNFRTRKFIGFPRWRAGVVATVPIAVSKNGAIDFPDLLDLPDKKTGLNTAGFRVETIPDPNDDTDKSLGKQYKYLPLRNIRPLSQWQLVLSRIPQKELHRSITYALTCMTAISVVKKVRLVGHWLQGAYLEAKACYLGSELITIGDTIRLAPQSPTATCTDVMVVESIRLMMQGFKTEHLDPNSKIPCASSSVHFVGSGFTLDKQFAYVPPATGASHQSRPRPLDINTIVEIFRPVGTAKYGKWYELHDLSKRLEVSYDQVLGRLYEADAISLWTGQYQEKRTKKEQAQIKPDLGYDYDGILAGRRYATKADERIPEPLPDNTSGISWLFSDSRAQALAVPTINGKEVAAYHDIRTKHSLREWRRLTYLNNDETPLAEHESSRRRPVNYNLGELSDQFLKAAGDGETNAGVKRGRPTGSKIFNGRVYSAVQWARLQAAGLQSTEEPTKQVTMANLNIGNREKGKEGTEKEEEGGDDAEEEEDEDDEEGNVPTPPVVDSQPLFRSSQMTAAAVDDTDEDIPQQQYAPRRSLTSRLAAYQSNSTGESAEETSEENEADPEEEGDNDDDNDETMPDVSLGNWQKSALPPTKSQIMESAENNNDSALDAMPEYEETDEEEIDWNSWRAVRNARGGTEESLGGDYKPREV